MLLLLLLQLPLARLVDLAGGLCLRHKALRTDGQGLDARTDHRLDTGGAVGRLLLRLGDAQHRFGFLHSGISLVLPELGPGPVHLLQLASTFLLFFQQLHFPLEGLDPLGAAPAIHADAQLSVPLGGDGLLLPLQLRQLRLLLAGGAGQLLLDPKLPPLDVQRPALQVVRLLNHPHHLFAELNGAVDDLQLLISQPQFGLGLGPLPRQRLELRAAGPQQLHPALDVRNRRLGLLLLDLQLKPLDQHLLLLQLLLLQLDLQLHLQHLLLGSQQGPPFLDPLLLLPGGQVVAVLLRCQPRLR